MAIMILEKIRRGILIAICYFINNYFLKYFLFENILKKYFFIFQNLFLILSYQNIKNKKNNLKKNKNKKFNFFRKLFKNVKKRRGEEQE
jgi:hypothetical protein